MLPEMINRERIRSRLRDLCSIAAPSLREKPVRDYLHGYFRERESSGLEWNEAAEIPPGGNTPNILLRLRGDTEPILLCAHLDTVSTGDAEKISLAEKDGILRSGGNTVLGADDRAGIVLAMEMIDLCLSCRGKGPSLEVLFTVQEELGCIGSGNLGFADIASSLCYNLDGETPPGSLITAAPFKKKFRCTVHGRSAHAALEAELGRNAVRHAAGIIAELPQGRLDDESTMNTGSIHGGGQTNIVPAEAVFTGELRSFSFKRLGEIMEQVEAICGKADKTEGYSVHLEWEHIYDGYSILPGEPAARRFIAACGRKGITPELLRSAGGGDANNLNARGIKTVVFGIGMHEIHTPGEYLVFDELFQAADLLRELLAGTSESTD